MTLAEMQSQLAVLVPEFPFSSYTTQTIQWLNDAQREVGEKKIISDSSYALSEADEGEYSLPDTCIELKKAGVFYDGTLVEPITLPLLIEQYGTSWKSLESGTPKFYLNNGGSIELVPAPDTDDKVILLNFWGYANALSAAGDIPFTTGDITAGYDYHNNLRSLDSLLVEYGIAMSKFSLGLYNTTQSALTNFYSLLTAKANNLKKRGDMEYNYRGIDPMVLRNKQRRLNCG